MSILGNWKQKFIAIDQFINTWYNDGKADETLSARAYRENWTTFQKRVDWVFFKLFGEVDHCKTSWESEVQRKHLPKEYSTNVNT